MDETPETGRSGSKRRIVPPFYFLIALLAAIALHWLAPIARVLHPPFSYAGALLIAVGLYIVIHAARLFARSGTTIKPFEESAALVTTGVYRFTRNPMYLGMAIALTGVASLLGSVSAFLPVPVFVWLISRRFIRGEEAGLAKTFGSRYERYRKSVRRWL